jgi:hypothetical protein
MNILAWFEEIPSKDIHVIEQRQWNKQTNTTK